MPPQETTSRRAPEARTTGLSPMTRSSSEAPRQEACAFRSYVMFVLAFLRQNLTNYVCTQIFGLYDLCIRVLVTPGL